VRQIISIHGQKKISARESEMRLAGQAVVPDALKNRNEVSHAKTQRRKEKKRAISFAPLRLCVKFTLSQTEMLDSTLKNPHTLA
jgi:hypothetical protein